MTDHLHPEPTPEELDAVSRALRALGDEPLPDGVAERLEARLQAELGAGELEARRRQRRFGPARRTVAAVAVAAAAAAFVVGVAIDRGDGTQQSASEARVASVEGAETSGAGGTAQDSASELYTGGEATQTQAPPAPQATETVRDASAPASGTVVVPESAKALVGDGELSTQIQAASREAQRAAAKAAKALCPPDARNCPGRPSG